MRIIDDQKDLPQKGQHQGGSAVPGRRPLYAQVQDLMVSNIVSGRWKPGQLLPSEFVLASQFEVSQGTVRKALNELEAQHLVVRQQGRGTFVSEHDAHRSLFHFFHIVDNDGKRVLPVSHVVSQRIQRASAHEAAQLRLDADAQVQVIFRVRFLNDKPIIFERLCLPVHVFPDIEFPVGKEMSEELYVYYQERYRVIVGKARELVRAVAADATDAKHLHIEPGTPLLEIERIADDLSGQPVELRLDRCITRHHHYFNLIE